MLRWSWDSIQRVMRSSFSMPLARVCRSADGLVSDYISWMPTISKSFFINNFNSIFVRHLHCERDEFFLSTMETFIKTTVGNGYNISLKNLFFRKRSFDKNSQGQAGPTTNEDREFFCSELIAKAYKEVGILDTEVASWKFMPVDFSK